MTGFDDEVMYGFMRKFYELTPNEVRIMDFLMPMSEYFGTYSDITCELGLDIKNVSNIRKAILSLEKRGIVYVERESKGRCNPMVSCYIVEGWLHALANG